MSEQCEKNKTRIVISGFFWSEINKTEFGPHEWGQWSIPEFRASEFRKVGKKIEKMGFSYQDRKCANCGIVARRQV